MQIVVDPHSGVPVYRQLMDQIKLLVASGRLRPGDELPSTRALSLELGVNPMTISKAYSLLERDEIVERRPGRPLVVKKGDARQIREDRLAILRDELTVAAGLARQLEIDRETALRLFEEQLAGSPAAKPRRREGER
jgi:GntR family transcriptional regulator